MTLVAFRFDLLLPTHPIGRSFALSLTDSFAANLHNVADTLHPSSVVGLLNLKDGQSRRIPFEKTVGPIGCCLSLSYPADRPLHDLLPYRLRSVILYFFSREGA